MADAELDIVLSDLSLDANLEAGGNVLHITLDGTGVSATASVTASAFSDSTLEDVTSAGSVSVKAQASLSRGLGNVSAMAFGEIYTGINSPYEDIVSWTGHPLSGSRVRVRTGNLRGIFGVNGEFGIYAGSGWDEKSGLPPAVNSQYIRLGNHTNEFHNVPVKLYDNGSVTIQLEPTAPSFAMGNPLPTGYNTGTGLWQGKDTDGTYKWRIGNPSGSNLSWNGANLLLQNASLDVSGSNVHIALGNPPPTSKTSGTGIWMDNSGIYGLRNNVKQVYIDTTTGIFYSGAGTVRVDEAGANIVIGTHDENNRLTGIELNSTGLFGKVADDVRFALANTGVPFLKLGTGEKDVDLTGIQIDETEIVGQNNGVDQVVFSASGKFTAGTGNVILDAGGISMNAPDGSDQWNAPTSLKICSFSQDNIVIGSLRAYTDYEYLAPPAVVLESFGRNADYSENDEYGWSEIYLYAHEGQAHTPRTASIKLLSGMPTIGFEIPSEIELQANRILINSNDYPVQFANNIPLLPSSDPTEDNQATRKAYVDGAYTRANTKTLIINCFLEEVAITADDVTPVRIMTIPIELNNAVLINADAAVYEPSTSGLPEFRLYNITNSENILSTNITIDTGELNSYTATTQPVIDDDEKVVSTGDRIAMFVKTAGTGTEGLDIILTFMVT